MNVVARYVADGETVGYLYENGEYRVAVTEAKAFELGFSDCKLLKVLSMDEIPVKLYRGCVYDMDFCMYYNSDESDYVGVIGETLCLNGYYFGKLQGIELDNETAIQRFLANQ